jgi:integrase
MTLQLRIPGWLATGLAPALEQAYERAAERVEEIGSANTRKAYEAAWHAWAKHCAAHQLQPLPIHPKDLTAYLETLSLQVAPNTVRLQMSALSSLDQAHAISQGDESRGAVRSTPWVRQWFKAWARKHPSAPRKRAAAITPKELVRVLELAAEPGFNQSRPAHAARYARDRCLLTLGCSAALRVGEVCALELRDVFEASGGLVVVVRTSKTDQHGAGAAMAVHAQSNRAICPVEAWRCWMSLRGKDPGPLFVGISRGGALDLEPIGRRQAMRIVTERCQAAGLKHVTSHSMRATFGTLSKRRPLSEVMAHGRWASAAMAMRYQRDGNLFESSPTRGLFDE